MVKVKLKVPIHNYLKQWHVSRKNTAKKIAIKVPTAKMYKLKLPLLDPIYNRNQGMGMILLMYPDLMTSGKYRQILIQQSQDNRRNTRLIYI